MDVQDLTGVGPVLATRLAAAGFSTVADIAAADPEALGTVKGLGPTSSQRLIETARSAGVASSKVAEAVASLRGAIPDLARSKKHAQALLRSTDRMAAWVSDLDSKKIRRRVIDETKRISTEAKKRARSNKAARALQGHAVRIEKAIRRLER